MLPVLVVLSPFWLGFKDCLCSLWWCLYLMSLFICHKIFVDVNINISKNLLSAWFEIFIKIVTLVHKLNKTFRKSV